MPNPMDMMSAMGGLGGPGGGAGMPPPPGAMPGGMPPGLQGPGGGMPPGLGDTARMGLAALDRLANKEPMGGPQAIQQIKQALELAQKLIAATLPMVGQMNAQTAKDLHIIGRQIADARLNLDKEDGVGPPPEMLMMGMQGTGMPGGPGAM